MGVRSTMYWKESVGKELRPHEHSVFNPPFPSTSYSYATTTSKETLGRTWKTLTDARTMAAGKGSFHYNVAKPPGMVWASATTASFERRPLPRAPDNYTMMQSYGGGGSSYASPASMRRSASDQAYAVNHATTISPAAAAAAAVLGNSASSPALTPARQSGRDHYDDVRSTRSSAASSRRSRGR